ncbi:MAG: hypothetical protein QY327_12060 [Fimbriimonadaceae bacterium]|nr:MAG: hypothetical protein UZ18_ATM001000631 [Armatimonadetes bacterium OLB18]WKZ80063.1 MAG: hypothetical protein QY327_12060 [Fimbriimonadaceae bacterium]
MATFFFDNDISFRVVHALRHLVHGHELIALRDRFSVSAKDTDWIPEAGQNGWVVISRDFNQRRRDAEHRALRNNGVKALYIRQSGNPADLFADAARIIKQWPKIQFWGLAAKPGTLAKLDSSDKISDLP